MDASVYLAGNGRKLPAISGQDDMSPFVVDVVVGLKHCSTYTLSVHLGLNRIKIGGDDNDMSSFVHASLVWDRTEIIGPNDLGPPMIPMNYRFVSV